MNDDERIARLMTLLDKLRTDESAREAVCKEPITQLLIMGAFSAMVTALGTLADPRNIAILDLIELAHGAGKDNDKCIHAQAELIRLVHVAARVGLDNFKLTHESECKQHQQDDDKNKEH